MGMHLLNSSQNFRTRSNQNTPSSLIKVEVKKDLIPKDKTNYSAKKLQVKEERSSRLVSKPYMDLD